LFLAYINDISTNIISKIRLFADDCIIYRTILNIEDVEKLQTDLDRLGEWAEVNEMIINPNKSKALSITRDRMKDRYITHSGAKRFRKIAVVNTWE